MRTYVYIDGFNLYYGSLRGTAHKWLDVKALFKAILRPENDIQKIKYFTARVSARPDNPEMRLRRRAISSALPTSRVQIEGTWAFSCSSRSDGP